MHPEKSPCAYERRVVTAMGGKPSCEESIRPVYRRVRLHASYRPAVSISQHEMVYKQDAVEPTKTAGVADASGVEYVV